MRRLRVACLSGVISLIFGCSGGDSGVTPPAEFLSAMPSTSTFVLDDTPGQVAPGQNSPIIDEQTQELSNPACHPHLFLRTYDAIAAINHYIIGKFFRRLDAVIDSHATSATSSTVTWIKQVDGGAAVLRITLTKSSPGAYALEVDAKAPPNASDSSYVTILTASITNGDPTGSPHTGSGTLHVDLTKLGSVITTERARGTIDLTFNVKGNNKMIRVTLTGLTGDDTNPNQPPTNANFVFARTAGVGGSFKYVQQTVFPCPQNPSSLQANLKAVHRWKITAGVDGGHGVFNGRTDGQATGGQITAGQTWVGVTCTDQTASTPAAAERFWQIGVFSGAGDPATNGGTLVEGEYDANAPGPSSCDSSLGTLPSGPPNYRSNYTFTTLNFNDASVIPFPGMPTPFP